MYSETMENMLQKIPVKLPKPVNHKGKSQPLVHDIGGGWYMNKLN